MSGALVGGLCTRHGTALPWDEWMPGEVVGDRDVSASMEVS